MSLKRETLLEIELEHTVNTLKIMIELLERENYPNTIERVQETVDNATKLLGEK